MKERDDIEPKPQDPAPESAEERQGRTALTSSSLCRRFLSARNVVAIAIAGSLLYFLAVQFDLDLESTWLELQRTDPAWYAAAFAIYYLNFPIRSIRWRVLLEDSGCEAPDARDKISILTLSEIGYLGWFLNSVSVFRMGFVYRCYQLSSRLKASLALIVGSLFAERILDTVVTLGLIGFAALFLLSSYWNPVLTYIMLGGLATTVVLAGVPIAMMLTGRGITRFLPAKLKGGYDGFREGTLNSFHRWPRLTVLSIAVWCCETARLLFVVYSLGLDVDISIVVFVALGTSIITTFPITPGGLGLVEAGMTGVLAIVLSPEEALSVTLLDRSINFLSVIALGTLILLARSGYSLRRGPLKAAR